MVWPELALGQDDETAAVGWSHRESLRNGTRGARLDLRS